MSIYDPYRLYTRSKRSTHVGQVLRKKYYPSEGVPIAREDMNRFLTNLTRQGYRIFVPGQPLPSPPEFFYKDLFITLNTGSLELTKGTFLSYKFSSLWDELYLNFSPLLDVPLSSVSDFLFSIDIISINYSGAFTFSTTSGNTQFQFYFSDPLSILAVPDTPFSFVNSNNNLISLQMQDDTTYLESFILTYSPSSSTTDSFVGSVSAAKLENTDRNSLMNYTSEDSSIIPSLKNKDYDSFNPSLYHVSTGGSRNGTTIVGTTSITVQVHLSYYKSNN